MSDRVAAAAGPYLLNSTTYDFDSLPLTLSADGWEECDGIAGRAKIDYDASGYWRIVGIATRQWYMPRSKRTGARLGNYQERYSELPRSHPLYGLIVAMLTTDRYVERRNINEHIEAQLADMRASAADTRADRVVRLSREAV